MFAVIIYRIQPGREPQLFVKRIVSGFESESEADKWFDALEGNVNDRSLIVELELSKKYGVAEGSPSEPNID